METQVPIDENTTATISQKPEDWTITGVLDWDEVTSVPLVLARKPLSWLWYNETNRPKEWMGDRDAKPERDLTPDELLIKAHFDQMMAKASPSYFDHTYLRGPWLRKLASFGLTSIMADNFYKDHEQFVKDWEEYKSQIARPSGSDADSESESDGPECETDDDEVSNDEDDEMVDTAC